MNIITHRIDEYCEEDELKKLRELLVLRTTNNNGDDKDIKIFDQLCKFEFGRWLLINRGLNSYWSHYLIYFDECCNDQDKLSPLEKVMLLKSPGVIAARERKKFDFEYLQKNLKNNIKIAAIPCGFMNSLLRLDLNNYEDIKLIGIDLDPKAIDGAKKLLLNLINKIVQIFLCRDAWDLKIENEFDILYSSGLNMYVKKEEDLLRLYSNFYHSLKPNGILMISSNLPPLDESGKLIWNVSNDELEFVEMQAIVYTNIINVRQGLYCTKNQILNQLTTIGFRSIEVNCDKRNMFLGFVARK